jgi:hypothetical protein
MSKYRFVGSHAEDLDDGSSLEPLQEVTLDGDAAKGKRAQRLIEEGLLLEMDTKTTGKKEAA